MSMSGSPQSSPPPSPRSNRGSQSPSGRNSNNSSFTTTTTSSSQNNGGAMFSLVEHFPWVLPPGADEIVRGIAAAQILRDSLQQSLDLMAKKNARESDSNNGGSHTEDVKKSVDQIELHHENRKAKECIEEVRRVLTQFPALCHKRQAYDLPNQPNTPLPPLTVLCAVDAPLHVIRIAYNMNPRAIRDTPLPLHAACSNPSGKNSETIRFLIREYPQSLEIPSKDGGLPIFMILSNKKLAPNLVPFLIKKFPEQFQKRTPAGFTPMHWAAFWGAEKSVLSMIHKLDPEQVTDIDNKAATTPTHLAASQPRAGEASLAYLLRIAPTNMEVQDNTVTHQTPLEYAAQSQTLQGLKTMLKGLGQIPPVPNTRTRANLLHHAVGKQNSLDVIEFLVASYPQMCLGRVREQNRFTPLHLAIHLKTPLPTVRALVDGCRLSLRAKDGQGRTPLQMALEIESVAPDVLALLKEETRQENRVRTIQKKAERRHMAESTTTASTTSSLSSSPWSPMSNSSAPYAWTASSTTIEFPDFTSIGSSASTSTASSFAGSVVAQFTACLAG